MSADDHVGGDDAELAVHVLLGRRRGQDRKVGGRRRVAEEHSAEARHLGLDRRGPAFDAGAALRPEALAAPAGCLAEVAVLFELPRLSVAVAAEEADAPVRLQQVEALGRKRPHHEVASRDDHVGIREPRIVPHRLESRQVSMHVNMKTAVLTKCARRCTLCFYLSCDLREKMGQIPHVDKAHQTLTKITSLGCVSPFQVRGGWLFSAFGQLRNSRRIIRLHGFFEFPILGHWRHRARRGSSDQPPACGRTA